MNVVILLGSVRTGRQSHKIAHYLEKQLADRGVEVDLIDLGIDALPIMGLEDTQTIEQQISTRLNGADSMLFVTPEYHGSFSGALKNALDYFWAEFHRKPIGVVAVSSGKSGGINAANQLQHVILSLGGIALPTKLLVPEIQLALDDHAEPLNDKVIKYSTKFINEFLWFTDAINQKKATEQVV